jgi:toxin ParE1/3/4
MTVQFLPEAQSDIQSIFDFIALHDPVMASRVVGQIQRATDRLAVFPFSGRVGAVVPTRELVVPRLPYIVVYSVGPDSLDPDSLGPDSLDIDTVTVIAVFHTSQNSPRG